MTEPTTEKLARALEAIPAIPPAMVKNAREGMYDDRNGHRHFIVRSGLGQDRHAHRALILCPARRPTRTIPARSQIPCSYRNRQR